MTAYSPGLSAKEVQALDAANLYYAGLTQQEVAQRLNVSRPAVSKLLAYAYLHLQGHVFQTRFLGKEFPRPRIGSCTILTRRWPPSSFRASPGQRDSSPPARRVPSSCSGRARAGPSL